MSQSFEKMGVFYLGRRYDPQQNQVTDEPLLYDAKDLCTHAVCVGMTGSGKTGLCLSLLEEAAIDRIPAIAIDPKGDLGNLMLAFPDLKPASFEPWVDPGTAMRKGVSVQAFAKQTADQWKKGLNEWGQTGKRVKMYRDAVDVGIYTPGSSAGLSLTVLKSLNAPPPELIDDSDAMRERVTAAVSGLLALLGLDFDPIQSRDHILLSNIVDRSWRAGTNLSLPALIKAIQNPPFDRIGVLDLESFYPSADRFKLSMTLNNLLASPGFATWMEGEPLNVQRLLWTPEGKPRLSIMSIAHLSDSERIFFVTMLLNEIVAWMRTQPGTTSLRALLYMDEVFGFLPPTANPPSKTPMLTLLKQARAYGLGCVLATQNPVDLDYKALSNAGTWFLGRLQTERDKMRVLDGLEGAAAANFNRADLEQQLAGMDSRVFLMHNVHDDAPTTFHTRWAMSYLRGPLTRVQIKELMHGKRKQATKVAQEASPAPAPQRIKKKEQADEQSSAPIIPVEQRYVLRRGSVSDDSRLVYRPALLGEARLHFVKSTQKVDVWNDLMLLSVLADADDVWSDAKICRDDDLDFDDEADPKATYGKVISEATNKKSYTTWQKDLKNHLYREHDLPMWRCSKLRTYSKPDETEGDFRARLVHVAREKRDADLEKLRKKYAPRLERLEERIRKAEHRIEREESQYSNQRTSTMISLGATLLGAVFGRKLASATNISRAGSTVRRAGRMSSEKGDIRRAKEDVEKLEGELEEMEAEFQEATEQLKQDANPVDFELDECPIRPRKSDIQISDLVLVWTPWVVSSDGIAEPVFG